MTNATRCAERTRASSAKNGRSVKNVNIDELGIETLADFMVVQDRVLNETGARLHLHDATLVGHCPWILQMQAAPKYVTSRTTCGTSH